MLKRVQGQSSVDVRFRTNWLPLRHDAYDGERVQILTNSYFIIQKIERLSQARQYSFGLSLVQRLKTPGEMCVHQMPGALEDVVAVRLLSDSSHEHFVLLLPVYHEL